jgi:putative heme iron utilization protein
VTTLVTIATDHDGVPILLISGLSSHTANLKVDGRCSILLSASGKGDPLAHPRLTVLGEAHPVEEPVARARLRQRFLARHPKAALYADFGDFGFWRLQVAAAHLNGGFARAADIRGDTLVTDIADAGDLIAAEESAIAHMNEDHGEAIALYATKLAGEAPGPWRMTGVDPEGFDLAANDRTARLTFPERIISGDALHKVLISLAKQARAG